MGKYGRMVYEFRENLIAVTIPFATAEYGENPSMRVLSNPAGLTKMQERILNELRNNPNLTRSQLKVLLGVGETSVYKGMLILKERGIIERVGANKNGYWKVKD